MPVTKEQSLAEVEDLLRSVPPLDQLHTGSGLSWTGRFSAVIRWDFTRSTEVTLAQQQLEGLTPAMNRNGHRRVVTLLRKGASSIEIRATALIRLFGDDAVSARVLFV